MRSFRSIAAWGASAASLALLVACSPGAADKQDVVPYHAAYPAFASSADLIKSSDLVVRGVAVSARVEQSFMEPSTGDDPQENPQAGLTAAEAEQARKDSAVVVTVSTVRVQEVIKGRAAVGDTIEVSQLGGTFAGTRYEESETSLLSADGTNYVLFLAAHGTKPYDLLNPEQALYTVSSDGTLASTSSADSFGLKNLSALKSAAKSAR